MEGWKTETDDGPWTMDDLHGGIEQDADEFRRRCGNEDRGCQ
jgi:hypothetical protein